MTRESRDELSREIEALGLDADAVAQHRARLTEAVATGRKPQFKIIDTCRLENHGLLAPSVRERDARGFVAFVPAAGAASRYSQPLSALVEAAEHQDEAAALVALAGLRAEGAHQWPLPARLKSMVEAKDDAAALAIFRDAKGRSALLEELQLPKALLPCVAEGTSFLEVKHREHAALPGLAGEVYVAPPNAGRKFSDHLTKIRGKSDLPMDVLEQGPSMSTLRFKRDGTPWRDEQGRLSVVPAGHGALVRLFAPVRAKFPKADSLFIRNIDNVNGDSPDVRRATLAFLSFHRSVQESLQKIRAALAEGRLDHAAEVARPLRALVTGSAPAAGMEDASDADFLWDVQTRLFHTPAPAHRNLAALKKIYARPLNTLGQVPNTAKDVGGTPCFVDTPDGRRKLCIEVPHASEADKQAFLANPAKATHFNPVFVAAELGEGGERYLAENRYFWLLAEKTHRGHPVVYYETVLYELLGNSELAHCLFVEVPRVLFNPHKTLKDAASRHLASWLSAKP